ncbi:hypothetical protein PENTCL1PPCAC_14051, partial [Pristionchus entomophagus]
WTLFLLLPATIAAPIRVRRGGVDAGVRLDPMAPSLTEKIESPAECYFKRIRSTAYEDLERRPKTSGVGPCGESPPDHRMSELLGMTVDNLQQAPNLLALVLMRGEGEFEVDWNNQAHVVGVGQRRICKRHMDELLLEWSNPLYYYMKRKLVQGKRVPVCSMPNPFFQHESPVDFTKTKAYFVEADEAEDILVEKRVLVHPGLPVCEDHNNSEEDPSRVHHQEVWSPNSSQGLLVSFVGVRPYSSVFPPGSYRTLLFVGRLVFARTRPNLSHGRRCHHLHPNTSPPQLSDRLSSGSLQSAVS